MRNAYLRWAAGLAVVVFGAACAVRPPAPPPEPSDPASPAAHSAPAPARPTTLDWRPTTPAIPGHATPLTTPPSHHESDAVPAKVDDPAAAPGKEGGK
jgi:hypothetical protein